MGLIAVRFDEKTEAIIKEEAAKMKMNVSDFIRYKLNLKDSSVDNIILSFKSDYWRSNFAKAIGLDGIAVDKKHIEEFINFVSQRDNIGDGKTPTLACDITFSVPKSVSLLPVISPKY